ncbi:primase-helicase family protein [Chryseobacterium sp. YIM B08800]|uniref:primase-helicase family protein n=1 Tax=Chryseobacterium sp. YIM B08800 TaxID=2984136 RepID=UPI002240B052|nr:primase-helicase family protein [Chryseobacterium sp. YIM B08800]
MSKKSPYLRVGTTYYKNIEKPLISGDTTSVLVRWNRETIINDHGKSFVGDIPKYDGFCCIPEHLDYQQIVKGFYNIYNEIPFAPSCEKEDLKNSISFSLKFVDHIFGEQLEMGLDYLKILLQFPTQILPILCLVSKERSTGKSTFIKWLKEIFGLNMTYIKGDSFGSQFNSDWAAMLVVAIDEVFFDKKEITERLKYLSTTNKDKLEAKGRDREEIDFFAKFILCSNNEENFIQIDENEIRFWILKINPIKTENTEFLSNLIAEIPYFLRFLIDRSFSTEKKTRMWFSADEIRTKALQKLVFKNNNKLESKIIELLYEFFESNNDEQINVVPQDLLNMMNRMFRPTYWTRNDIRNLLKETWKLVPQTNGLTYIRYDIDFAGTFYQNNSVGRFFTIKKDFILGKYVELLN